MSFQSVYSKVTPGKLLHVVANALDAGAARVDLSPPGEHLQASIVPLAAGRQVKPHIHDLRQAAGGGEVITQESWLVLRGKVRVRLYDMDRSFLEEEELLPGWLLMTFNGGHSLECLQEDTVMVEFKNGPYLGRDYQSFPDH